jgi:hypothetical protein
VLTSNLPVVEDLPGPPRDGPSAGAPVPLPPPPRTPPVDGPPAPEPAVPEPAVHEPAIHEPAVPEPNSTEAPAAEAAPTPASVPADDPPSDPVRTVDTGEVVAAIEQATTARARLAAVATAEGENLGGDDLLAVVRAVPDGWQRRRTARRLVSAGALVDIDADALINSFARDSDRIAVAGALVAADLAQAAVVADHLDARAADRLQRRVAPGR